MTRKPGWNFLGSTSSADKQLGCYVDVAWPDLADALKGSVGSQIWDGQRSTIVEILGASMVTLPKYFETAWLCMTERDPGFAVLVFSKRTDVNWDARNQKFDDIAHAPVEVKIEPGRRRVIKIADPAGAVFRPFALQTHHTMWSVDAAIENMSDDEIQGINDRPAQPVERVDELRIRQDMRVVGAGQRWMIEGRKVRQVHVVIRRIHHVTRAMRLGASALGDVWPRVFSGQLEYAVTRDLIRAYEGTSIEAALALVPDHAANLRKLHGTGADYRKRGR